LERANLTSHEAGSITDQKSSSTSIFLRLAQSSQHILLWPIRSPLWKFNKQLLDHSRNDVTGRDGVDSDTILTPFASQVTTELDYRCFGSIVGGADESLFASARIFKRRNKGALTLFATVPLMEAIITILPPLPNLTICLAAA
jgi:hypothetical protein